MEIGTVERVDIDGQIRAAYLDYAMSVIVSRALPDAARRAETRPSPDPLRHVRHGDTRQYSL